MRIVYKVPFFFSLLTGVIAGIAIHKLVVDFEWDGVFPAFAFTYVSICMMAMAFGKFGCLEEKPTLPSHLPTENKAEIPTPLCETAIVTTVASPVEHAVVISDRQLEKAILCYKSPTVRQD